MTEEHKEFLDELRDSGVMNMLGAAPVLAQEFGIPRDEARKILTEWIASFDD